MKEKNSFLLRKKFAFLFRKKLHCFFEKKYYMIQLGILNSVLQVAIIKFVPVKIFGHIFGKKFDSIFAEHSRRMNAHIEKEC